MSATPAYVELHCLSCFSFQRGASTARELFARARQQGYRALAITDECTLAGIVRAHQAAEEFALPLIVGSEVRIEDGPRCVLLVEDAAGYQALCALITRARRRVPKGRYRVLREDFDPPPPGLLALWLPGAEPCEQEARWLRSVFPERAWLAVELHRGPDDEARLRVLLTLAARLGMPAVASGDVHMHVRKRRALQDTMTAIRLRTPLAQAGHALFSNGERHLRTRAVLASIHPTALMEESVRIAERCRFNLKQLDYRYPAEVVPAGHTAQSRLRQLVEEGLQARWARSRADAAMREEARQLVEKELAIIGRLGYEAYFLTVHDIVRFARSRSILCQGRGSAANSAVCYALGITELEPGRMQMLFERFVSEDRNEPPDIDVDFEHERREEVLQYVFERYGRERAALTAVVISYRGRSAVRDVARALGLPSDQVDELAATMDRWSADAPMPQYLRERGFDPDSPLMQRLIVLSTQLLGMPRHLSQHPGGFVISEHPLSTLVPVENAAMDERTVLQWDKDDLDAMGIFKVDCLALGILSCLRRTVDLLRASGRRELRLEDIPAHDEATFRMIRAADTVGVFQIESRAQMAMLPRLRPKTYYDLVVQVAIVRPGPIQGDMVHPYLRRRCGEEPVTYPSEELRKVFERTLGVPLFQEQVMQLAIVAAGYRPGEADQLRRSMAAWKRHGGMEEHRAKIVQGMLANGYTAEFAEQIFEQIRGFGSYGFPESHAASFALLAWSSSWLKCHEPAAFAAALINSQPMGFYSPSQIVQDVRRHGIEVRPVDVRYSDWDCTLEARGADGRGQGNAGGHAAAPGGAAGGGHAAAAGAAGRDVMAGSHAPLEGAADEGHVESPSRGDQPGLGYASGGRGVPGNVEAAGMQDGSPRSGRVGRSTGTGGDVAPEAAVHGAEVSGMRSAGAASGGLHGAGDVGSAAVDVAVDAASADGGKAADRDIAVARGTGPGHGEWTSIDAQALAGAVHQAATTATPQPALRLGLRLIEGLGEAAGRRIEAARRQRPFADATDLCLRAQLDARQRALLADSGALKGLLGHRHKARWAVAGVEAQRPLFDAAGATPEARVALPMPRIEDDVRTDYATLGLTLEKHPLALLRPALRQRRFRHSAELRAMAHGQGVAFAGLVTLRQRPGTASGVTFLTLEDEHGLVNVVVWAQLAERQRRVLVETRLMGVRGRLESQHGVLHLIAARMENLDALLGPLDLRSRDFH